MKEIFQGNISKEAAETLKELQQGGGSGESAVSLLFSEIFPVSQLTAFSNIHTYFSDMMENQQPFVDVFLNDFGEAIEAMNEDGIKFYDKMGEDPDMTEITITPVHDQQSGDITSIEFSWDDEGSPVTQVWTPSADGGETVSIAIMADGNPPQSVNFSWTTQARE